MVCLCRRTQRTPDLSLSVIDIIWLILSHTWIFLPNFPNPLFKNFDRYLCISLSLIPRVVSGGRWRWVKLRATFFFFFFFGLKRGRTPKLIVPRFRSAKAYECFRFTELAEWSFRTFSNREGLIWTRTLKKLSQEGEANIRGHGGFAANGITFVLDAFLPFSIP